MVKRISSIGVNLILICGSRIRSNETRQQSLVLPRPLIMIDVDPCAANRTYLSEIFVAGDCAAVLAALSDRLEGRLNTDPDFGKDISTARKSAEASLRAALGPYAHLADALAATMPEGTGWVRDITISATTWAHRMPNLMYPRQGIHALGGGIGQGLPMAIGAAVASSDKKVAVLVGDGGLMLSLGELATLVQECVDVVVIVMNDGGYGVIRNMQDRDLGGRRAFVDLQAPSFEKLCDALQLDYLRVEVAGHFRDILKQAFNKMGPVLVEVDMQKVGPYAQAFAGPPARQSAFKNKKLE